MALLNWLTRFANKNNDIHHLTFSEYKNKFNNIYNISVRDLKNLGETGLVSIVLPVYRSEEHSLNSSHYQQSRMPSSA